MRYIVVRGAVWAFCFLGLFSPQVAGAQSDITSQLAGRCLVENSYLQQYGKDGSFHLFWISLRRNVSLNYGQWSAAGNRVTIRFAGEDAWRSNDLAINGSEVVITTAGGLRANGKHFPTGRKYYDRFTECP
jgi:hypothetical protein